MAITIWTIVFINLLSGVTMWPIPSTSSIPLSMYDMCTKTDLHQIEELKKTLFEDFNRSSTDLDENGPSVSFGLLNEDWERLLLLENRIPEGSVLKSKLLVVFRILIAALYQAHGAPLANPGEQEIILISDDEQNGIDYGERISSSELDVGESNNCGFVFNDPDLINCVEKLDSNEVAGSSGLPDDDSEQSVSSNSSPTVSDLTSSITTSSKYINNSKDQTVTTFQTGVETKLVSSVENNVDAMFGSTHLTKATTSYLTAPQEPDETTMVEPIAEIKIKQNENKDLTKLNYMPISPVLIEEEINATTTEKSPLEQMHNQIGSEYVSTDDHTISATTFKLTSPTFDIISPGDAITTTHTVPFDYEEIFDTTNYFDDRTEYSLYPEVEDMFQENERVNNKSHDINLPLKNFEDTLNFSASNSDSWESNQLIYDMDGADSVINEVMLPDIEKGTKSKEITNSDAVEENQSYLLLNKSDSSENDKATYEPSTIYPREFSTVRGNTEKTSHEKELTANNGSGIKTRSEKIIISDHDSSSVDNNETMKFNLVKMNQTTVYESTTEYLQLNESENEDASRMNTRYSNNNTSDTTSSIGDTTIITLSLRDGVTKKNITHTNTLTSLGSSHLSPRDNFYDFPEHHTSNTADVKRSSATTTAGVSLTKPDSGMTSKFERDEDNVDKHVSSEREDDTERSEHNSSVGIIKLQSTSVELNSFSPTNVIYGTTPSMQFIPKRSEFVLSEENHDVPSTIVETKIFSPKNNDDAISAEHYEPESSEYVSGAENTNLQNRTRENYDFNRAHDDDAFPAVQHVRESTEHESNVENEHSQSRSVEQTVVNRINDDESSFAVRPLPKSSENVSSEEKEKVQSSIIEKDDTGLAHDDDGVPSLQNVPENLEHVWSAENENLQSGIKKDDDLSRTHDYDDEFPAVQHVHGSSEHVSFIENDDFQSSSVDKSFTIPNDDDEAGLVVEPFSESSEHESSAENENVQGSIIEKDDASLKHGDDAFPSVQYVHESSELVSSVENEHSQSSSVEKAVINQINDDVSSIVLQPLPESSEHESSAENENLQSSIKENNDWSTTHNDDSVSAEHHVPESSEHVSFIENDDFQSSSVNKSFARPNNDDEAGLVVEPLSESSEHELSAENENVQGSIIEKDDASLKHDDDTFPSVQYVRESSELVSSVKNEHSQISSVKQTVVNQINDDVSSIVLKPLPESSEHESKAENENFQSSIKENNDWSTTHNDDSISSEHHVPESSEHVLSVENEHVYGSSIAKSFARPNNDDEADLVVEPPPESSEHESSAENETVKSIIIEKVETSLKHDDDTLPPVQYGHESSEHVSSVENENSQSSSVEQTVVNQTNDDESSLVLQPFPEQSQHESSAENENFQSSIKENNDLITTHNDDSVYAEQHIPESSEHVFRVENEDVYGSSIAKSFARPNNDDEGGLVVEPLSESAEVSASENSKLPSAVNYNLQNGKQFKNLSIDSKENQQLSASNSDAYNLHVINDHPSKDTENKNAYDKSIADQDAVRKIKKLTEKEDNTVITVTDRGEESFKTFNVGFTKLLNNPLPTHSHSELKIFPKSPDRFRPSNFALKGGCRNGNDCVHVQHIQYKTSIDPLPARQDKRGDSKFESETRYTSQMDENMLTRFITSSENVYWKNKLRNLKESAYE